jgi:dTDP-4-amino-4,6-dideoxygalactose transaminase
MTKIFYPQFKPLNHKTGYLRNVNHSILNNKMTLGPKCLEIEMNLKKILKVKHVILTTSGTSALMMAALATKIKKNEKVLCSNLAWVAATNPFLIMNARLKVVDTYRESQIVDMEQLKKSIIKYKPKVVILVHLNGQPNLDSDLKKLQKKYNFIIIEDAAQSFLSNINKNKICGTSFDIGCYSLSFVKPVNMVYGGFCCTNSDKFAKELIAIRDNGVFPENVKDALATTLGLNLKPSDIHAAIGLENLKSINLRKKILLENFNTYKNLIKTTKKIKFLDIKGKYAIPNFAEVLVESKKDFIKFCNENGIGATGGMRGLTETGLVYGSKSRLKNSLYVSNHLVRLPFGPGYKRTEIKKIATIINTY